jgi:hypothetical protein
VTRAKAAAYAVALLAALGPAHFLLGLPIQVSDSFGHLLQLVVPWESLLSSRFTQDAYLRPAMWAEMKVVYELADGNYTAWFRWTHVAQVIALVSLFVALVRPRTWRDLAWLPLSLVVLLGIHTFTGTVAEAFPLNTYMTLLVLCLAGAVVALARYRWWNDVLAALLFVIAALTLETGLLLWVVFTGAALVGARGVSRSGLVAVTVLLGAYVYARFVLLDVGTPTLVERSSGFGFTVLDPPELIERFGSNPLPLYLYNIISSVFSVLLSEPTAGVFRITRALTTASVPPVMIVNVVASAGVLALLAAFAWTRWRLWLARRFEHDDRLVLLFGMVLVANAVISYPYTKDVIMSPAGVFLAAAVFAAARQLFAIVPVSVSRIRAVALIVAMAVLSTAWSLRMIGLHVRLRQAAVVERLDWAYIESDIADRRVHAQGADARLLLDRLRHDALIAKPAPPALRLPFQALLSE